MPASVRERKDKIFILDFNPPPEHPSPPKTPVAGGGEWDQNEVRASTIGPS